jgi:DNA topoisomerase II
MSKEEYQKLDQVSHVLLRPDTYVGSVNATEEEMFVVVDPNDLTDIRVEKQAVTFVPAFLKIFDEIITNASDHSIRTGKVKSIKVVIDERKISIENDGPSVPIKTHQTEKDADGNPIWIPEMIFFHLLSGSNFNDTEQRFVGGRNGLGSKLCNIFSNKFILETCDGKQRYKQVSDKNLSKINAPLIEKKSDKSYTRVTFYPDYEKFGMDGLTLDTLKILTKRILDIAAYIPDVRVSLNGKTLPIKSIKDYMKMHLPENAEFFYEKMANGWEIGVAQSPNDFFQQMSIVNGITTYRGGTHVNKVALDLSTELADMLSKGKVNIKWKDVKDKLFLFLICRIPNPVFDTQTKENLKNTITKEIYGDGKLSAGFMKKIMKSEIVETILNFIELKKKQELAKMNKSLQKVKVEKLIDAKGKKRGDCILGIFEGESAKSSVRQYRDPNTFGAYPLRGKFLNVSELSASVVIKNAEVQGLISSIGLNLGGKVDEASLRYGRIYIFCDADKDGDSISAQLINFFYKYWKELFEQGRVFKVQTPLLVAQKGKKKEYIYTQGEFELWSAKNDVKSWEIEYKKGLASLVDEEYEVIINTPRLIQLTPDTLAKENLDVWFGKDSDKRKDKLKR